MAEAAAALPYTKEELGVAFPNVRLDGDRCRYPNHCSINAKGDYMENRIYAINPSPSTQPFNFLGTCGTAALPEQNCYWEVRVIAGPSPRFVRKKAFCEVGVATMEALNASRLYSCVSRTQHAARAVVLEIVDKSVNAAVYQYDDLVINKELIRFHRDDQYVTRTLGFLLNFPKKTLAILDVSGKDVMCEVNVDLSQRLWPFCNLVSDWSMIKADVSVKVETAPKFHTIIRTLLKKSS